MYLADAFTLALSLAGLCGLSLPCGFDRDGLPIGLQIMGGAFHEATVLRVGHAYEQATGWSARRPPLARADEATAARLGHAYRQATNRNDRKPPPAPAASTTKTW
jgi:aspartyl-tRNA(Asn)/glutamyl-tRNA(Gln) amidotransferase subunit A